MAKDRRLDRWIRPGEDTEVIPPVKDEIKQDAADDAVTGEIPVPDNEHPDFEHDDEYDDEDRDLEGDLEGDLEPHDTDTELEPPEDRLAQFRGQAAHAAKVVWQRVVALSILLASWLAGQLRIRVPQFARWMRPRLTRQSAAIVAGLLLCSSYPRFNWWWAAVIAFAVLAWVLTRPATSAVGGFGYGFLFGLAFYLPLIRWISILVGAVPLLALVLLCAVFPGIFGFSAVAVRRLPGWPIWFAVLWAAQEWLKSTVPFGGFPWGVVAAGQTSGPFLPLVRLGSAPLLSLAIVLTGCSAAAIILETVSWWRSSHHARATGAPPAVTLPAICICLVFFAAAAVWPQVRHSGTGAGNEPAITAAVVQGNVPRLGLEFNAQRLAVLANDVKETRHLADDVHAGRAPQPDFVVWPEDSSEIDPLINPDAAQQISVAVEAIGAPILVGTVLDAASPTPDTPAETNTVIVWNPKTGPGDRHDKRIVQPFGEYLPWRGFFRHLSSMANWAGYIVPGKGTGVVQVGGTSVGVATCWEVIFDRALRDSVRNGAQLIAVPANNANFNQTMSEQQLAFSKVRAVELDRYAVVSSNVGISALITPDGRELGRTKFFTPAYLDNQVRLKTSLTPAARWGPIVQAGLVIAAIAVLLAGMLHNGWFNDLNRRLSELAKKIGERPKRSDDDPQGDHDVAASGDDAELDEDGEETALDEGGRYSAHHGPEKGEI